MTCVYWSAMLQHRRALFGQSLVRNSAARSDFLGMESLLNWLFLLSDLVCRVYLIAANESMQTKRRNVRAKIGESEIEKCYGITF